MSISRKQRAKFRKTVTDLGIKKTFFSIKKTFKLGLNPFDKSKRKQKKEKGSGKRKWRKMLKNKN